MTVFSVDRLHIATAMQTPLRILRLQHHDPGRIRAVLRRGWRSGRLHRDPGRIALNPNSACSFEPVT